MSGFLLVLAIVLGFVALGRELYGNVSGTATAIVGVGVLLFYLALR